MVPAPGAYGLVLRKTESTKAFYERYLSRVLDAVRQNNPSVTVAEILEWRMPQDDHLWACSVAQSIQDLERVVRELEADGAVPGRDFVPTESTGGVMGPFPGWLRVELEPTGNPPELEARMEPEVRMMWERSRRRVYHYKQD